MKRTQADELTRALAKAIFFKGFGENGITERLVQTQFEASRSHARNAIFEVENFYGLIDTTGYGFRLSEGSREKKILLLGQRFLNETFAAQTLARSQNHVDELKELANSLHLLPNKTRDDKFSILEADANFHRSLAEMADLHYQASMIQRTIFQLAFFAKGYFTSINVDDIESEHSLIVDAIESADHDRVISAIQNHLLASIRRWPIVSEDFLKNVIFKSTTIEMQNSQ